MNGRTCQLCGKVLSRFTVGSGGDFCSREHRNQFRLRLGMDRLLEANKVASLMRRRENAKVIPAGQLARDSQVLPRLAPVLRLPVRQPDVHPLRLLPVLSQRPTIVSRAQNLLSTLQAAAPMRPVARPIERDFNLRPVRPLMPPRNQRFAARVAPAGAVLPCLAGMAPADSRREAPELRLNLQRTHLGGDGVQVRPLRTTAQNCQEPQQPRRVNNSADRGRELRVSGGIGFRLLAARIRPVEFTRPSTNPPVRPTEPRSLSIAARQAQDESLHLGVIRFSVRGPSGPTPPSQSNGTGLRCPGAKVSDAARFREDVPGARTCDLRWTAPVASPPRPQYRNGVVRLRSTAQPEPTLSTPPPRGIESTRRLTAVSFQPRETPFECSPSILYGTLLSGMHFGAAPVRKVEPVPATLEEHFDTGLQNWTGGTADWKVDVAGVRAGSLALYSPSLELSNYLLEFLTRIELRGVAWVFRAASFHDYYKATLAVAPGGGYEFRRCLVTQDSAEAEAVVSVPAASPAPTGKTAVTLRTRVAGNEYTVSLDGQVIDTWTDARLTAGGIGFVGAPEERARLYWVKVTPIGHLSKEYSKR